MSFQPPVPFNIAHHFLTARIEEGRGDRICLHTDSGTYTYGDVDILANRFANLLREAGVQPEDRVIIAMPDSELFVGALFGILKLGAVVVMVNPHLKPGEGEYVFRYSRATAVLAHDPVAERLEAEAKGSRLPREFIVVGDEEWAARFAASSPESEIFPTHPSDPAIWLFSGGTTGRPKGVVQSHRSFANSTECYAAGVVGYTEDDVTLSVPKLYFGYATGSNLLFPMSAGASAVLFEARCTPEELFERIQLYRPTILINVPTMVNKMVSYAGADEQDLSCLRLATSAGEALPVELHERWNEMFGCELLDGLGTAEMWHVFISNRPGDVRPGTLGTVVPGFDVRVCDEGGAPLPDGEVGTMWVRGDSRANGYWQHHESDRHAFRGEWYVSSDMIMRNEDGSIVYCGRADDMLKVSGKWLSPTEVEDCLQRHEGVAEAAVVGITNRSGLTKPYAFVVPEKGDATTASMLQKWVKERLAPYKYPREIIFMRALPRTHLGKVDRGKLKESVQV